MHGFGLLSVLIWLPILGGVAVLALGERSVVIGTLGGAAGGHRHLPDLDSRLHRL